jgi:hypothetical protein
MLSRKVNEFLSADNDKIDKLIENFPVNLPVSAAADFLGIDVASVRATVENGIVGLAWRKQGKANHGYFIPTPQFVRWYLSIGH